MKTIPHILLSLFLLIGISLPMTVQAKGKSKKKPTPTKIEEATITAVTATSITVSNEKPQTRAPKNADNTQVGAAANSTSKTYQISGLTNIEVDGASADVSALHVGMSVSVSADPPSDLGPADESNGGLARSITAHDAKAGGAQ